MLVEAQSTWTPNIAVRALPYYAGTLRRWVKKRGVNLYDGDAVRLPAAEIYVVYTGTNKSVPNKVSLTRDFPGGALSAVDVTVTILRDGRGGILSEYVEFTKAGDRMRKEYGYGRATAIRTVEYCIERNILREHLIEKRSEVVTCLMTFSPWKSCR